MIFRRFLEVNILIIKLHKIFSSKNLLKNICKDLPKNEISWRSSLKIFMRSHSSWDFKEDLGLGKVKSYFRYHTIFRLNFFFLISQLLLLTLYIHSKSKMLVKINSWKFSWTFLENWNFGSRFRKKWFCNDFAGKVRY